MVAYEPAAAASSDLPLVVLPFRAVPASRSTALGRGHTTCWHKCSTGGTSYQSRQPRASHVEQHRGVWYGLSVDGRWQSLVGPWPVPTGSPRAVLDVEETARTD
jgi:hypothetical protein